MTTRRLLVLTALGIQGAVVLLALTGAPFELRLPVGLAYVFAVPGFAVVGLLRLSDTTTEGALSLVTSVALVTTTAQVLAWMGVYSLAGTLAVLTFLTTGGLLLQLWAESLASGGRGRPRVIWPRSYWS